MDTTYSHVAASRTGHSAIAETESNLAERYPADGAYWQDFEIVSVGEAALLSLGIEPRDIRDPDGGSGSICNGQFGREYVRRRDVLRNAIAAKALAKAVTDDPAYSNHIAFKSFVAWAAGKGWSMPEWMLVLNVTQAESVTPSRRTGIRDRKKAETLARHQEWQTRAEQVHAEHPDWPQLRISKYIAPEFGVELKTINNNIKIR